MINSRYDDPKDANFPILPNRRFYWRRSNSKIGIDSSLIYRPEEAAKKWDSAPPEVNVALGSRAGFCYVVLKVVGKVPQQIPCGNWYGLRARLQWTQQTDNGYEISGEEIGWVGIQDFQDTIEELR